MEVLGCMYDEYEHFTNVLIFFVVCIDKCLTCNTLYYTFKNQQNKNQKQLYVAISWKHCAKTGSEKFAESSKVNNLF